MTNEEKRNIYNAIQNLYNMDFTSWQEVLAMMYNLVADTSQKFEVFEQKFDIMLGSEVTKAIKELYENGKLTEIINSEVFKNLNSKIDYLKDNIEKNRREINEQLDKIKTQTNDIILVGENENTDIKNEVLSAFNKTNHVRIRKGNFNFSHITLPRSNLTLDCEDGCKLTMLSMIGVFASGKENININNLNIDGAGMLSTSDTANGSTSIYMEKVKNLTIENVKTENTGAWGIAVTNQSKNITIKNNKCNGSKRQSGIAISGNCSNFTVDNNYCNNNYYSGIIVEPHCVNGDIINNKCINNKENGIIVVDCENSLINVDNNTVLNSKSNITSIRNQKVNIINNKINGGTLGIQVEKTNIIDIKDNSISDCNSMGISMLSGDGQPKMVDVNVSDNSVINCTLTDTREHAASYFIRDCDNLIFNNNISNNSKTRDYSISANTFLELKLITPYSKAPNASLLNNIKKPFKFKTVLNSTKTSESFIMPYDIEIFAFSIKKTVVHGGSNFTQIRFNDEAVLSTFNETNNSGKTVYFKQKYSKRLNSGDIFKISYAHSMNMEYVKDIEIELFYF